MSKADKLRETFSDSKSDTLRIWAIDFLEQINNAVGGGGGGALATEATLISVLNAIVASDQDIEILLVRDTVTLIVYQQITDYTTGVPVVTYKDVNGAPFVPVNPMEYLDPSAVLSLILAQEVILATPVTGLAVGGPTRVTNAAGSPIAAGKRRISVMNTGDANGSVNGNAIAPGESITWNADGLRDTLAAVAYDGTGTELVITTIG
jgi:hypothetical protein